VLSRVEGEGRDVVGINGVTDETSSRVRVETEHEEEGEMMGVPKRLKALVANLLAGRGVHEQHDEEHEMTRDATRLGVVDLEGDLLANLSTLNIDKVDIVSSGVDHGPECHGVGDLSVEPDVLVGGEEPCYFGTDDLDDVAEHGNKDETTVKGEDQAGTPRRPHGVLEPIQGCKFRVSSLTVPPITEEEEVKTVENEVEGEPSRSPELSLEPTLAHC